MTRARRAQLPAPRFSHPSPAGLVRLLCARRRGKFASRGRALIAPLGPCLEPIDSLQVANRLQQQCGLLCEASLVCKRSSMFGPGQCAASYAARAVFCGHTANCSWFMCSSPTGRGTAAQLQACAGRAMATSTVSGACA